MGAGAVLIRAGSVASAVLIGREIALALVLIVAEGFVFGVEDVPSGHPRSSRECGTLGWLALL